MGGKDFLENAVYDPNKLLDALIERLHLKNDTALAHTLEATRPVISKIRHRITSVVTVTKPQAIVLAGFSLGNSLRQFFTRNIMAIILAWVESRPLCQSKLPYAN